MSITNVELPLFQPSVLASNFSTSNIGGGASGTQVLGTTIGELTFLMAVTGSDQTQYAKFFIGNTDASLDLSSAVVWMPNQLAQMSGSATAVSVVSTSASDNSSVYIHVTGADSSNNPISDQITMNGTSTATGSNNNFTRIDSIELRNVSTGNLVTSGAIGTITITANTALGVIPAPMIGGGGTVYFYTASTEILFALVATL